MSDEVEAMCTALNEIRGGGYHITKAIALLRKQAAEKVETAREYLEAMTTMRAQIAELQKDAERYRWLRKHWMSVETATESWGREADGTPADDGSDLDVCIDAAITGGSKG